MLRNACLASLAVFLSACVSPRGGERLSITETAGVASAGAQLSVQRAQGGLARPLVYSPALQAAAEVQADHLSRTPGLLGHVGPGGSTAEERAAQAGYRACVIAENVARGQPDVASVLSDWMQSPQHRANILNAQVTQYGFARSGSVWVLKLARPC
jgi:uncharacterized protein YkwD